ncbi:MAG: NAD(P)H-binding protein [Anaerolineae bacterium]
MTRVLVTGGTGGLGREVVTRLGAAGCAVRVMSRRGRPQDFNPALEWAQADVETGAGLAAAVANVDVIVNAVTSPAKDTQKVDVEGTQRLLEQARTAKVGHFLHVSIVGIERIPFPYYRHKVAAEQVVENGGVPYSILRATQFHSLVDGFLQTLLRYPLGVMPADLLFQPIDTGEAADCIVSAIKGKPGEHLPDIGGPERLRLGDLAQMWLKVRGKQKLLLPIWLPGGFGHALRNGYNTTPNRYGKITWTEWLNKQYGNQNAHQMSTQKASV